MKIMLSGGGTLGSVTPLLALAAAYRKNNPTAEFVWVGTKSGPEKAIVEQAGIRFISITSGKLRRYFSFRNFTDPFKILFAFFQSRALLKKIKPDLLVSVGGFVSVPLHRAAYFLKIPTWVHQQDIIPGLANILMAKAADKVTTASALSVPYFKSPVEIIGNFCRDLQFDDRGLAKSKFGITDNAPVILAMGGGTGAVRVNELALAALASLPADWHVIHLVGLERAKEKYEQTAKTRKNYLVYQFLDKEMAAAYAASDLIISRAGFGAITELAALAKPSIILPIPESPQEANAKFLADAQAALVLDERKITGQELAKIAVELVNNNQKKQELSGNIHRVLPIVSGEKNSEIISFLCHSRPRFREDKLRREPACR
ncbi:MAG: UDP-N-acetylglucosamine--N-acetylmuramyl-(pentapeptide) pyrophosphoryl-undecaprenol N-acetylglucosamine transferase [Patescibacteria group bacterium]|nr:UDP-N-acetylglucosamine--N-acetylmuramyl-(pentapeptide) pyrophosphoryl-undecaprenol N-acetylglucosamine transferase [Patescibacteria group bacterium]